jgi:solute carrier family 25 oxoglutarate transporter 11
MHETGGGLTQFYTGFQAHFYARMGYLFIRNTLYKFIYDIIKPVKPSNDLTIREKMLLAGTVGGIAAFLTSPLELISIRQSLDTQIPKAWRRNYGSPQSALEAVKKSPGLWHGASINVLLHVLLNISLTAPYDWLH